MIVVAGDTHAPFHCKKSFDKLFRLVQKFSPWITHIIQLGDLLDAFAFSNFAKVLKMTASDELISGWEAMAEFWLIMNKEAPHAKKIQLLGNHDARPFKRLQEKFPEAAPFVNFDKLFLFEGVQTILDPTQEFVLGDICFMHGWRGKLGDHVSHNLMNTVCGHSHRGGVHYRNVAGKTLYELNAGYLGDPESTPLRYQPQKWTHWTHGCGVIDEYGPRFIPF